MMQHAHRWKLTATLFLLMIFAVGAALAADEASGADPGEPRAEEPGGSQPQDRGGPMSLERLDGLLRMIDENAERQGNIWRFMFGEHALMIITDEKADRMRIMAPIAQAEILNEALMLRILQANFDSALDARYAVARGMVWSTFIHSLAALSESELVSAIFQVSNAAATFGTTFSSGVFIYGGGDSENENRKLLEALQKRLNPVT